MTLLGIPLTNLLGWIVLGLAIGFIFHQTFKADTKGGAMTTGLFGIIGAFIAGIAANQFLGVSLFGFEIINIVVAVAGSLILAALAKLLFKDNRHIKTDTTQLS